MSGQAEKPRVRRLVVFVKKEDVLGNRVPVGQTASYFIGAEAENVEAWARFRRDHPDENSMEWEVKVGGEGAS